MIESKFGWKFSIKTLESIINRIIEARDQLKQNTKKDDYSIGLLDGYNQCLDMIKNDLESRGYDFNDFLNNYVSYKISLALKTQPKLPRLGINNFSYFVYPHKWNHITLYFLIIRNITCHIFKYCSFRHFITSF